MESSGNLFGVRDRFGKVPEQQRHFFRVFQPSFGVLGEQATRCFQRSMILDAGEHIQDLPVRGVADTVGSQDRQAHLASEHAGGLGAGFLLAVEVALQLDVHVLPTEYIGQLPETLACNRDASVAECGGERPVFVPGQADQSGGMFGQFFQRGNTFTLPRTHLHTRDQPAQVAVALPCGDQQGIAMTPDGGDLRTDVRPDAQTPALQVKPRRAEHPVPVDERHRRHVHPRRHPGKLLGLGSCLEKTECGCRVQFHIHVSETRKEFSTRRHEGHKI